ncbi:hypothetical protein LX99_04644 [Mucilaginibacter oryzae]|uniref:Uncharacterized protein n=1 Tax=Mucilaginibacter oryzae TaxID=468058 RepID=A0A316H0N7_9SPHI|nr:hypothetical protein [Mucilaginibacter oryzae]PWK69991.1 hypothetical protein LX99_04644 [Mucilaginibacter oryzae]
MKIFISIAFILLLFSCSSKPEGPVVIISLTSDKKSLQIKGFDAAVINDIARDSSSGAWQTLMPVYKMPADTDLKNLQQVQPGRYTINNNIVVFTPDTAFATPQSYFLRYYDFDKGSTLTDLIKSRSKPGALHYSDLIFKP